jgi:hypothetical protein
MAYGPRIAMLPTMLEQDRTRARTGWSVGRAAWRLGVSVREYREIEPTLGERPPDQHVPSADSTPPSWWRWQEVRPGTHGVRRS